MYRYIINYGNRKAIIEIAPSGLITIIIDEIYVKNRLNLLGNTLLQKVNHIIYVEVLELKK